MASRHGETLPTPQRVAHLWSGLKGSETVKAYQRQVLDATVWSCQIGSHSRLALKQLRQLRDGHAGRGIHAERSNRRALRDQQVLLALDSFCSQDEASSLGLAGKLVVKRQVTMSRDAHMKETWKHDSLPQLHAAQVDRNSRLAPAGYKRYATSSSDNTPLLLPFTSEFPSISVSFQSHNHTSQTSKMKYTNCVALLTAASVGTSLPLRPRYNTWNGQATFYSQGGTSGSCGQVHSNADLTVAISNKPPFVYRADCGKNCHHHAHLRWSRCWQADHGPRRGHVCLACQQRSWFVTLMYGSHAVYGLTLLPMQSSLLMPLQH